MKRQLLWIGIAVMLVIGLACSNETQETTKEPVKEEVPIDVSVIEEPSDTKVIRIGFLNYPPYEYLENDQVKGPLVDIVTEALDQLGYQYEIHDYSWTRLLEYMENGEIDMAIDTFDTVDRRAYLLYPEAPIGFYEQNFIVRSDSLITYSGNLKDMKGMTIGTVQDYSYGTAFDRAVEEGFIHVESGTQSDGNFQKLLQGRVEVIIENSDYAAEYIKKNDLENKLKILQPSVGITYTYCSFSKINNLGTLRSDMDTVLKAMHQNGRIYDLFETYGMSYLAQRFESVMVENPPRVKFFQEQLGRELVIGALNYTPPYIAKVDDRFEGLFVDIIDEAFQRIGVDYVIKDYGFARML